MDNDGDDKEEEEDDGGGGEYGEYLVVKFLLWGWVEDQFDKDDE